MARRGTSSDGKSARPDAAAEAAAALYGLPLGEFTAARAQRARLVRADGDRDAAAAIGRLPKPSVVAWLANQLARQYPAEIHPLLELGGALREATADLDAVALRQLSQEQHQVVSALVACARELGAAAGQAVSDSTVRGLEDTLHAALADEQAAQELTQGQLADGLSRTGFPGLDAAADGADVAAAWAVPAQKRARPAASATPGAADRSGSSAASGKQARADGSSREAAAASPDLPSPTDRTTQRTRKAASDRRAEAARAAAEARRQQLGRAQRAEADARADADEASRDQVRARTALTDVESAARQAEETISRLQDELDAALDARNNAGRVQRQARKDTDRADRTARQAERRLTEATARREELERDT